MAAITAAVGNQTDFAVADTMDIIMVASSSMAAVHTPVANIRPDNTTIADSTDLPSTEVVPRNTTTIDGEGKIAGYTAAVLHIVEGPAVWLAW